MRRSTFTDDPVTYAAIGATLDPDLLRYPPAGFKPSESTVRLGSGRARFETAVASLLTWGVQRGSGVVVSDIETGTGRQYAGVAFDEQGSPLGQNPAAAEERFGEDGTPYIAPGMKAVLHYKSGPLSFSAPVRVVLTVEEAERVGFAIGTLEGHPEDGETLFLVEHRDDDSVWFTIRMFSRTASGPLKALAPFTRAEHDKLVKRYLRSLHPVGLAAPTAPAIVAGAGDDEDAPEAAADDEAAALPEEELTADDIRAALEASRRAVPLAPSRHDRRRVTRAEDRFDDDEDQAGDPDFDALFRPDGD